MKTTCYFTYKSWSLRLSVSEKAVCECRWTSNTGNTDNTHGACLEPEIMTKLKHELTEYFDGQRTSFDLPLEITGTPFQRQVWEQISTIPYGHTVTYGHIAHTLGKTRGAQAIGQATGANHIAILIPCHRVVGADNSLTGYAGGMDIKRELLNLEKNPR